MNLLLIGLLGVIQLLSLARGISGPPLDDEKLKQLRDASSNRLPLRTHESRVLERADDGGKKRHADNWHAFDKLREERAANALQNPERLVSKREDISQPRTARHRSPGSHVISVSKLKERDFEADESEDVRRKRRGKPEEYLRRRPKKGKIRSKKATRAKGSKADKVKVKERKRSGKLAQRLMQRTIKDPHKVKNRATNEKKKRATLETKEKTSD